MCQALSLRCFLQDGKKGSARKGKSRGEDSDADAPDARRKQAKGSKKAAKGGKEDGAAKGNQNLACFLCGTIEIVAGQTDEL